MQHISKYIFSICLVFSLSVAQAQVKDSMAVTPIQIQQRGTIPASTKTVDAKPQEEIKKDSVPVKTERYGLRVGIDLYHITRSLLDKDFKGSELVADLRLTKKLYLAGEFGYENKTTKDDLMNFTTEGSYYKLGIDHNSYENWTGMENMLILGARYGVSTFSQTLNNYDIYNRQDYFRGQEIQNVVSGQKYSGLSAQWIELVLGVKAKLFNNVFMGFSFRLNQLVYNNKPQGFDNLYIPGFNRTYANSNFGVGFNYTVSYFIPIYKKKVPVKTVEKKK